MKMSIRRTRTWLECAGLLCAVLFWWHALQTSLINERITLEQLEGLHALKSVSFEDCRVGWLVRLLTSDSGLVATSLTIDANNLIDVSIVGRVNELTHVRDLTIQSPLFTDVSVQYLADLDRIEHLSLARTNISGRGVVHLCEVLPQLISLRLSSTNVRDSDLNAIINLTKLQYIALDGTRVSGKGIERLCMHRTLKQIDVKGCACDAATIAKIQKAHPSLEIIF